METATNNLVNDHVHILRLIDVMEQMMGIENPNISHLETAIDLIRNYADGFHHAKEENLLFPLLVQKGFTTQQGPIAVMLSEHEMGRDCVRRMTENIALLKEGNSKVLPKVYIAMKSYIDLLRNHINKENNVLFPMADGVLSDKDQLGLLLQFEEIEQSKVGGKELHYCIDQIEQLANEYII